MMRPERKSACRCEHEPRALSRRLAANSIGARELLQLKPCVGSGSVWRAGVALQSRARSGGLRSVFCEAAWSGVSGTTQRAVTVRWVVPLTPLQAASQKTLRSPPLRARLCKATPARQTDPLPMRLSQGESVLRWSRADWEDPFAACRRLADALIGQPDEALRGIQGDASRSQTMRNLAEKGWSGGRGLEAV